LKGLDQLWPKVPGKRVLDLGCAEGLISAQCLIHGAEFVTGAELVKGHVDVARRLVVDDRSAFLHCDLNDMNQVTALANVTPKHTIVLMLAILHKLQRPDLLVREIVLRRRPELIVLRTPESTPGYVRDERSGMRLFDTTAQLWDLGYKVDSTATGHFEEHVSYFVRRD